MCQQTTLMSIMFGSIVTANSMDNKVDGCTLEQSRRYAVNHFRGFVVRSVIRLHVCLGNCDTPCTSRPEI